MNKNMKTYLITHLDLDGYMCGTMAFRYLGRDILFNNVNYDTLAEAIMEVPRDYQLFITDLSIPDNLKGLLEEFERVIIIDHHISTSWALDWAKDNPNVEVIVDTSRCATWHFYEYLAKNYGFRDTILDDWAKFVDDYDRYVLQYPESRMLNALFYISDKIRFCTDALYKSPQQMLEDNKERVDRYLRQQKEYIEQTTIFQLNVSPCVVMFFAEKNKSAIAEVLIKERGVDLAYGVDLHNMAVSLRSSPVSRIDCSQIAKMIHPEGGGHRNASGARLDTSDWLIAEKPKDGEFLSSRTHMDMIFDFPKEDLPTYREDE